MKLDLLVVAAHPDDAELGCGGTIAHYTQIGKKVGILDLTQGELGTRGNIDTRNIEAQNAAKILGLTLRENLKLPDGFFQNNQESQLLLIEKIRQWQPEIIIGNTYYDRHPDHGKASDLLNDSCFLSGLSKIITKTNLPWRPRLVLHYIQDTYIKPNIVMDITSTMSIKIDSIKAYESQFYNPKSIEPATYISQSNFLDSIFARARETGKSINTDFAEGFLCKRNMGVNDLFNLQ